ncbi:MAG: hypothetical protein HYS86_02965 [Candidatus Chisholmbacteria bacterium]|nr:hypothetical protein [Candidatus Chisholmbacteria bacterium]
MPTKVIIVLLAALALLGGGYFLYLRSSANPQTQTENPQAPSTQNASSGQSFTGSLIDLLTLGQNYTCTFQTTDDSGAQTSGLVFVSSGGDKLSGEFEMRDTEGTVTTSNIVSDGEYNYIWSSEMTQGFKTKIEPGDSLFGEGGGDSETPTGIDENKPADFNCTPWLVDQSKFVPPSNIEFVEFAAPKLETLPDAMEDSPNCSVCDQVSAGDSRDQCLQALGC